MKQDLLGDLKLRRNGSNASVGGRALIPREGSLKEAVKWARSHYDSVEQVRSPFFFFPLEIGWHISYSRNMLVLTVGTS